MTVKQLIEELNGHDPERIVVMSRDAEGNGYSPLAESTTGAYAPETTWYGEVGLEKLTQENIADGYGEEDVVDGQPCLVLWPVN